VKLLTLTNRYYFASIIVIVIIGGLISYQIFKASINKQFNEKLLAEKEQLIFELHSHENIKDAYYLNIGDKITLEGLDQSINVDLTWLDTLLYDEYQKKKLTFRQIRFSDTVDNSNYLITISKSLLSTDELITGIGEVMLILMFSLIIALVLISDRINKTVWQPFQDSLTFLKSYDITNPKVLEYKSTRIEEFHQLNDVISLMIEKSIKDYESLKEFSENASHEIQTPLTIIKAKSELLMQDDTLSELQINGLNTIYTAANRLSKLNHDLAFLTKIDNNQFQELTTVNLREFISKKLEQFEDLIALKNIVVNKNFIANPTLQINDTLIYVLVTNLLNNAIKHNFEGGVINVKIKENEIAIENTGEPLPKGENAKDLFLRFRKASQSKDPSGLGLALVKKICEIYGFQPIYSVNRGMHKITIIF
jgi:hypothetical protein